MGGTHTIRAIRRPGSPGVGTATIIIVALLAALCTPTMAAYTKDVSSPAACNTAGEFTQVSMVALSGWYSDARVADTTCKTTSCYYRWANFTTGYGQWRPNLAYSGWYKVQTTYAGDGTTNTKYAIHRVYHKNGNRSETINQNINHDTWVYLNEGTELQFDSGANDNCRVRQTQGTTEGSSSIRRIADTCRWIWAHPNDVPAGSLTATNVGSTRIDLSWSAVDLPGPNADGSGPADGYYAIYRSEIEGGEAAPPADPTKTTPTYIGLASAQGPSGTITFSDTGLAPDTTYYYKVYAWETGYSAQPSNEANAHTEPPFGAPTKATITTGPANGATGVATDASLNWTAGDADSYDVWFDDGTGTLVSKGNQVAETYSPSGMVPNHTYKWRIIAKNGYGTTQGDVWTFTTGVLLTLTPSPSEGGTCSGGGWFVPGASVSPTAAADTGYAFVKWSTNTDATDTVTLPYTMPSSAATLYAIFEISYTKQVGARCADPASEWYGYAGLVTFATYSTVSPCGTTGCYYRKCNLISDNGYYRPTLAHSGWYKVQTTFGNSGVNSTRINYRVHHKNGSFVQLVNQSLSSNYNHWVDLNGGTPGATFQFDAGQNPSTGQVYEYPGDPEASTIYRLYDGCQWVWDHPNAPTNLTAFRLSDTEIALSWSVVSMPADGYHKIERKTGPGGTYAEIAPKVTDTGYIDSGLAPDTSYFYRVRAHQTKDSGYSNEASASTNGSAVLLTVTPSPSNGGTCTGTDWYTPGTSVTPTEMPNTGWTFVKWSTDPGGSDTVTVPYVMPAYAVTLYAIFETHYVLTVNANPSAGGTAVATGSNPRYYGESITATATATIGYNFLSWSTDPGGADVVSTSPVYTFAMPNGDYTLYANFGNPKTWFVEGFETRATGDIDSNENGGPNVAVNGNKAANPWFGADPPDCQVGATAHSGAKGLGAFSSATFACQSAINLSYRFNSDDVYWGKVFLDWWFNDPKGQSDPDLYRDYAALCMFNRNPILGGVGANLDYNLGSSVFTADKNFHHFTQQMLAIGARGWDASATYDSTKYQIHVQGAAGDYGDGWFNTTVARSTGWHRARIVVGPRKAGGTNDVSFYIDDMDTPVATIDSTTSVGYNAMACWMKPTTAQTTGYMDDFTFATTPAVMGLAVSPQYASTTATATWSGIGAASYQLKVDSGAWMAAASPYVIDCAPLAYGSHTVYVKPFDSGGNEGTVASTTFSVDKSSIRNWDACGFYPFGTTSPDPVRFATDFFNSPNPDGSEPTMGSVTGVASYNGKSWVSYASPSPIVNFDTVWGHTNTYGVNYAFTYIINSGSAITNAYLTAGSDDGIKVWVNGSVVLSNDVYRVFVADQDLSSAFTLEPGWNRLLVKETQATSSEVVQVRPCASDKTEPAWLSQISYALTDLTGSIVIDGGAPTTANATVTLTLSATEHLCGVGQMSFSNDNTNWSDPEPFATTRPGWRVSSGTGTKTVYVEFYDTAGNASPVYSASITETVAWYDLSLVSNPGGAGTLTGAGAYQAETVVAVSATANVGYTFSKWTSDQAGNNLVSSSASFNYTMPAADKVLYAQFTPINYTLTTVSKPTAGGTLGGDSGSQPYKKSCTVTAAANPGYFFACWSTDPYRTNVVSTTSGYTFTMPHNDYTLYACFNQAIFIETFEKLNTGSIDMNQAGGPNAGTNGNLNGQPWWGTVPPNGFVGVASGLTAHTGTKALWDGASGCGRDYVNLAYRCNSGSPFLENIYVDWWFYDRCGTTWTLSSGVYCDDPLSICYNSLLPTDKDYPDSASTANFVDGDFAQKLSLGMADIWTPDAAAPYTPYTGFDNTKYQARIKDGTAAGPGTPTAYANGWYNLGITRSAGWHHGRITVGALGGDLTNQVSYYIDDMTTPLLTGSAMGFNGLEAIELITQWKNGPTGTAADTAVLNWPKGAMYDDIVLGAMPQPTPTPPAAAAASNVLASSITWNWTEADPADGYHVCTAATLGTTVSVNAPTTSYDETGLDANTQISRWVSSYYAPVPPYVTFDSTRTALAPTYTLALTPTYGTTGDGSVSCSLGQTSTDVALGTSAAFTATNGFGSGKSKASKYAYVWNSTAGEPSWAGASEWTSGTLTFTPSSVGTYYLHLRSYNGAGVVNTTSATFGPYTFVPGATPVAKISDLWPLANGPAYSLAGKTVTGVVGNAFWIEETNRSAAIKVTWTGAMPARDHSVNVAGVLDSSGGQRVLVASSVTDNGAATAIKPLGVVEKSAGGKAVNTDTPSITDGKGLYNIAILVRIAGTAGNANTIDPNNKYFYLDDGSGLLDGTTPGIKVLCGSVAPPVYPPPSEPVTLAGVTVTGLVGVVGGKPVIVIRDSNDIRAL